MLQIHLRIQWKCTITTECFSRKDFGEWLHAWFLFFAPGPLQFSLNGKEQLSHSTKHLLLCSMAESQSYGFGTTWRCVTDDKKMYFCVNYLFKLSLEQRQFAIKGVLFPCSLRHVAIMFTSLYAFYSLISMWIMVICGVF